MTTPNYDSHRIDGPVLKDVEISVGEPNMRHNITLLKGQYVTVIVLTNRETHKQNPAEWTITEKRFNP
jgi:hypothetical protein